MMTASDFDLSDVLSGLRYLTRDRDEHGRPGPFIDVWSDTPECVRDPDGGPLCPWIGADASMESCVVRLTEEQCKIIFHRVPLAGFFCNIVGCGQ